MWIFGWLLNGLLSIILNAVSLSTSFLNLLAELWRFLFRDKELRELMRRLKSTQDYNEWLEIGAEVDEKTKRLPWRYIKKSSLYDYEYTENMLKYLIELKQKRNPLELARLVRALVSRDFSNITNEKLYRHLYSGTKKIIDDFYAAFLDALDYLAQSEFTGKRTFFKEIKDFYGKTCLILSGGANLGMFHSGLLSNLLENDILPTIISGASAGSLLCGLIGVKTTDELKELAKNDFTTLNFTAFKSKGRMISLIRKLIRLVRYGYFIDKKPLMQFLKDNSDNMTFLEAYKKTGKIINIPVSDSVHNKSRLLNYITAPDVYIWSAALASCSLPFVYAPSKVFAKTASGGIAQWLPVSKKFLDGSLGADVPKKALGVLFNATNFIVSQANIFMIPFITRGTHRRHTSGYVFLRIVNMISGVIVSEFKHRIQQLTSMGIMPNKLGLWANLVVQEYTGDINIVPEVRFRDIIELFNNPSAESLQEWCRRSRNTTFSYVRQIKDVKQVEDKLAKIYTQLKMPSQPNIFSISPDKTGISQNSINWD